MKYHTALLFIILTANTVQAMQQQEKQETDNATKELSPFEFVEQNTHFGSLGQMTNATIIKLVGIEIENMSRKERNLKKI